MQEVRGRAPGGGGAMRPGCELNCLTRQCLRGRRIGERDPLRRETAAWAAGVNQSQCGVNWQMTVDDARCRLKSVYPKITE